eukprot:Skav230675  [mRNA]  locus=scaffold2185:363143:369349:- [translate_table: standard]
MAHRFLCCGGSLPSAFQSPKAEDEACQKLLDDLPSYALYAVAKNEADIRDTLRNRIKAKAWPMDEKGAVELDLLWPGAGYDSVACAGSFEDDADLLYGLRKMGGPNPTLNSATNLASHSALERDLPILVFVSNWVLHNFTDRDQCVQAYEASGEASLKGALAGRELPGLKRLGRCCDGGGVLPFPGREGKLAFYHHSYYGSAATCTMETIDNLFRKGVDDTIRMFCDSYDTCKFKSLQYGGTILGYSREISWDGNSMTGLRASARFLNVQKDEEEDELP